MRAHHAGADEGVAVAAPRFARLRLDQLNLPAAAVRTSRKKLDELKQSIQAVGVLVPLIVRALGKGEHAVIARRDGSRRSS